MKFIFYVRFQITSQTFNRLNIKTNLNGGSGIGDRLATDDSLGGVHSNSSDGILSQMLGDLEDKTVLTA